MNEPLSPAPDLPGFTYLRGIGRGGFADVFLYQQHHPKRQLAVKVLRSEHVSPESLRAFEHEANTMAEISEHQFIVAIHDAGVAPDGRPYILMEHYPNEHFGLRARGGRLPLSLVLEVGVQVASAVATAHQHGITHRDIKPANILTSRANRPGLTDFGISTGRSSDATEVSGGYTLPYAAPEVLRDARATGSRLSDIYSLAATVYCLLEGRSPFWRHGEDNSDEALEARILSGVFPPLERLEVTASLRNLLANAMSADPSARPSDAVAFANSLRDIELENHLTPTPIELLDDIEVRLDPIPTPVGPRTVVPADDGPAPSAELTRAGSPPAPAGPGPEATVGPTGWAGPAATAPPTVAPRHAAPVAPERTPAPAPPGPDPAVRPDPVPDADDTTDRRSVAPLVAAAIVVLVLVIAVLAVTGGGGDGGGTTTTTSDPGGGGLTGTFLDPPSEVAFAADGPLTVTWTPPAGAEDATAGYVVSYSIETDGAIEPVGTERVAAPPWTATGDAVPPAGSRLCVQVSTEADTNQSDPEPAVPLCQPG